MKCIIPVFLPTLVSSSSYSEFVTIRKKAVPGIPATWGIILGRTQHLATWSGVRKHPLELAHDKQVLMSAQATLSGHECRPWRSQGRTINHEDKMSNT